MTGQSSSQAATPIQWWKPALFFLVVIAGLWYVKWQPYYGKAFTAAETHSIGKSILAQADANPWQAALDYAMIYFLAVWKAAVLGDMLELGPFSPALHSGVGECLGRAGIQCLVAVGEESEHTAQGARDSGVPLVYHCADKEAAKVVLEELKKLVEAYRVEELVMGFPRNMDGTEGPRAEKSRAVAQRLTEATGLEVVLWDERRSSIEAHGILHANGRKEKKHRQTVDAVAASLILEGYLGTLH